jgi:hypothetical protein
MNKQEISSAIRVSFVLFFALSALHGQLTDATLKGSVTDSAEGVVAGSVVTIRNDNTGYTRSTVANESGTFLAAGVSPGSYTLSVTAPGFKKFERRGLTLNVGQATEISVRLDVGDMVTGIEVNGGDAIIPVATEARLSDTFAQTEITTLPLPGRDVFLITKLSAGAAFVPGTASSTKLFNSPVVTVNGNRYRGNNYVLDGSINVNANNTGEPGIVPSLESVEEAQIQTDNFSSEYGRGNGSVINLRTKSGANDLHGKLWEYHKNGAANARNFFAPGATPQVFNQFGGNVGGPIVKNKTFFFVAYEATRNVVGQAYTFQVETPEFRDYVARTAPSSVANRLFKQFPAPTPLAGTGGARYAGQIDLPIPGGTIPAIARAAVTLRNYSLADQYLTRLDHAFHDGRDKLSARWIAEREQDQGNSSSQAATLGKAVRGSRGPYDGHFGDLNVGYVHVFARAVNDARFSAQQNYTGRGDPKASVPEEVITGITAPFGDIFENKTRLRTYEWRDTMTLDRGRHALRFGAELRRIFKGISIGPATPGTFNFASLADFAADRPFRQTLTVDPASGQPAGYPRYFHLWESGLFFQDDWKISSRLNVTLGVRHDYLGAASERDGRLSSIIWGQGSTFRERLANASLGRVDRLYSPQKLNFSPRIGLAYDPFGDGKTSIRAGFSKASQPHHGQSIAGARALPPDALQGVVQPANGIGTTILYGIPVPYNPEFARGLNQQGGVQSRPGEPPIRITGFVVNPTIKTQYSASWFFDVQRELSKGWIAEIGYVGTRGVNLERLDDVNRFAGDLLDGKEDRINPNFGQLVYVTNGVNSIYNAMTAELRHKFARGFSLQTNYRWSKWLDTASDTSTGQFTDNSEPGKSSQSVDCLRCDRGPSLFDIPHRFSAFLLWTAPAAGRRGSLPGALRRGWEVSAILTAQSGRPFSIWNGAPARIVNGVNLGGDYNLDGGGAAPNSGYYDRPNAPATPLATSFGRQDYINGVFNPGVFPLPALGQGGNLGRNTFRGPRNISVDAALARSFPVGGEHRRLQFRIEAFNLLNNVNLYLPNADLSLALRPDGTYSNTSLFGKSTQAFDARSLQGSVRFVF